MLDTKSAARISALLFFGALVLTGCNTVEGFGRDTQAAGDAIEDTADDTKKELTD
jgi:predicted small secreted protein